MDSKRRHIFITQKIRLRDYNFYFLLLFCQFNLTSLFSKKRKKVIKKYDFLETKVVEILKYGKNNNKYQDKAKLYKLIVSKALPIAKAFYLKYSLLFLFDNVTNHSVYIKNILQIQEMNKNIRGKEAQLYNGWFEKEEI